MNNFLIFYFKFFGVEITLTDGFAVLFIALIMWGIYGLARWLGA